MYTQVPDCRTLRVDAMSFIVELWVFYVNYMLKIIDGDKMENVRTNLESSSEQFQVPRNCYLHGSTEPPIRQDHWQ
jgi:hypothetical protein